ncbi:MAG: hypothetical protein R2911_04775 [Caldilineaceae bacterium]
MIQPVKTHGQLAIGRATGLDATVGASSGFLGNLPFLKPGRGRLKLPAPSSSSEPGRSSGCCSASLPVAPLRMAVTPPLLTSA